MRIAQSFALAALLGVSSLATVACGSPDLGEVNGGSSGSNKDQDEASPEGDANVDNGEGTKPPVGSEGSPDELQPTPAGVPVPEKVAGPKIKDTNGEVWKVDQNWTDSTTTKAKLAGIAWGANSGLTWEQKYSKWLASFESVDGARDTDHKTMRFVTPQGTRVFDGPVLECADVAIWMRATFASWYGLPFYATGTRNGKPLYMGHFGVVDEEGNAVSGFPAFKTAYQNYESSWTPGSAWPSDASLKAKHVGADDDSSGLLAGEQALPAGSGVGAYYDALYLNKRVGHLLVIMDANFGSMHLADGVNMYHATPESTRVGDVLVQRWQKSGVGHTVIVVRSAFKDPTHLELELVSGGMPRHQPDWENKYLAMPYFSAPSAGGPGAAQDDPNTPLAKLGGGLRRFRVPVQENGRWMNIVADEDRASYIKETELTKISARVDRFGDLLTPKTPAEARVAIVANIESSRKDLMRQPASCSTRERREGAFKELYTLMQASFGKTKAQVDAEYRTLEDYVFAELDYTKAKTCCWNSANRDMANIVLDYAKQEKAAADAQNVCRQPTAFRATGGNYNTWKTFATSKGKGAQWKAWSEDEPCPQRGTLDDTLTVAGKTAMCTP